MTPIKEEDVKSIVHLAVTSFLLLSVSTPAAFSGSLQERESPESPAVTTLPLLGAPAPVEKVCQRGWNANDDYIKTAMNTPVTFSPLENDSDTVQQNFGGIISGPSYGTAKQVGLDTITYTPNSGFTGTDSFTYHHIGCYQCSGSGISAWCSEPSDDFATVYITVN